MDRGGGQVLFGEEQSPPKGVEKNIVFHGGDQGQVLCRKGGRVRDGVLRRGR
jgi:hypothetical protein